MFDIEEEIKRFRLGRDYYFSIYGNEKVYTLISVPLKEAVCPFPKIPGINGSRKSEKNELGNYVSYEEGVNGSPDKFTVIESNGISHQNQKNEEIRELDKQAKELDKQAVLWDNEAAKWDRENARIAQNPHPRTVSFSVSNDKGEKIFEKTKTSTYYPPSFRKLEESTVSSQIEEISEEEVQKIENEQKSELDRKRLESYQHQLPKK